MSELHDKARTLAEGYERCRGRSDRAAIIRGLLAENARLLEDRNAAARCMNEYHHDRIEQRNRAEAAEAKLRALCEREPVGYSDHLGGVWRTPASPMDTPLIPRPSMEDFKARCDLCGYQHGHKIGCDKNPLEIALRSLRPSMESYK